jgi:hypothetical protein
MGVVWVFPWPTFLAFFMLHPRTGRDTSLAEAEPVYTGTNLMRISHWLAFCWGSEIKHKETFPRWRNERLLNRLPDEKRDIQEIFFNVMIKKFVFRIIIASLAKGETRKWPSPNLYLSI